MITVPVHGRVVSALTVSPASLFLGVLEPGQTVTKQVVVRAMTPFRVTDVLCSDACFSFEKPTGQKKLHFIPVTFTARTPGKVDQTIEIRTDFGSGVSTSCGVTATVAARTADASSAN
jgi:phage tail sheath gpL-like